MSSTPDTKGKTALVRAAENRRVRVADHLIRAGADPNHAATRGKTALMRAVLGDDKRSIDRLLDARADVNQTDGPL